MHRQICQSVWTYKAATTIPTKIAPIVLSSVSCARLSGVGAIDALAFVKVDEGQGYNESGERKGERATARKAHIPQNGLFLYPPSALERNNKGPQLKPFASGDIIEAGCLG